MLSSMVESFFTVLPRHLSRSNAECKEGGRSQTQCFLSYLNFVILLGNISEVVYKFSSTGLTQNVTAQRWGYSHIQAMWPYAAVHVKGSFFKQLSLGWGIELRQFV